MNLIIISLLTYSVSHAKEEVTLMKAFSEAEKNNPQVFSAILKSREAEEHIRGIKSEILPSVDIAAVALRGNPGASNYLGVGNNLSTTQRVGEGGMVTLQQNLWDFGKSNADISKAEALTDVQKKSQELTKIQVDQEVLQTYLNCVHAGRGILNAKLIVTQSKLISEEINKYIKSGQRSIVEKYLVDIQTKEIETKEAELLKRQKMIQERLALELGRKQTDEIGCSSTNLTDQLAQLEKGKSTNPLLSLQKLQSKVYEFNYDQVKAQSMPKLVGMVSGGYYHGTKLTDEWNYSAGVGITMPLFEGFRIDSELKTASIQLEVEQYKYKTIERQVDENNSRFDEQIEGINVRLEFLNKEKDLAHKAYDLAFKRYFSLQGNLVDLRESLRNLDRVHSLIDDAERDYLMARGMRALYNGSFVSEN